MDKQLLEMVLESGSVDKMVKAFDKFDRPNSLRGFLFPPRKVSQYEQFKKDYAVFWKQYKAFKDSFKGRIPKDNKLVPALAEFVRLYGDLISMLDGNEDRIDSPPNKLNIHELKLIDLLGKAMEGVFRYLYVRDYYGEGK